MCYYRPLLQLPLVSPTVCYSAIFQSKPCWIFFHNGQLSSCSPHHFLCWEFGPISIQISPSCKWCQNLQKYKIICNHYIITVVANSGLENSGCLDWRKNVFNYTNYLAMPCKIVSSVAGLACWGPLGKTLFLSSIYRCTPPTHIHYIYTEAPVQMLA